MTRSPVIGRPGRDSARYEEPFHARRVAQLPEKLRRIGVLGLSRETRILDACCGRGEALRALEAAGFLQLEGVDTIAHPEWDQPSSILFHRANIRRTSLPAESFDAILNLHALHDLGDSAGVRAFLQESRRLLRPGGHLYLLDFPGSPQIRLLFWALRRRVLTGSAALRNCARIIDEEWSYLHPYLRDWKATQALLRYPDGWRVVRHRKGLFIDHLELEKLPEPGWSDESESWTDRYSGREQRARRLRDMPEKLRMLAAFESGENERIVDLCCGTGEAIEVMSGAGYRRLVGIDYSVTLQTAAETRSPLVCADVRSLPLMDGSVSRLLNIHALHHLRTPENVEMFLVECHRVLEPGGRLGIVDFPASPQIRLAFWLFRIRPLLVTSYLRWFGSLVHSEWHFLEGYLARWRETRRLLFQGIFEVERCEQKLFYYHLVLRKATD